jgi:hypothetical protein
MLLLEDFQRRGTMSEEEIGSASTSRRSAEAGRRTLEASHPFQ